MTRLVGFESKHGEMVIETGEVRPWSNRYLRCVTDENLEKGEFGLKIVQQKLKKAQVCKSLGISENSSEDVVNNALCNVLNSEISMTIGLVKDKYEVNGFRILNLPNKK